MRFTIFLRITSGILSVAAVLPILAVNELPPGVQNPIDPDGKHNQAITFTTQAFQREALQLLIQEANRVAQDLKLPERLPITEGDLTRSFVAPFGYCYANKSIGNIVTSNFLYKVAIGYKFNGLTISKYDEVCLNYRELGELPISQLNTNEPYQLATQWLRAASMDVAGLNRDCKVRVEISPYWNGIRPGQEPRKKAFIPIYYVSWISRIERGEGLGAMASVELFGPTKSLIALNVDDSKYILRKPLIFTNLAELLSTNAATTNAP